MTPDEARGILKESLKHIDLMNLGRTMYALGQGYTWTTFDNSRWRANKNLALREAQWLADNADKIYEALKCIKGE